MIINKSLESDGSVSDEQKQELATSDIKSVSSFEDLEWDANMLFFSGTNDIETETKVDQLPSPLTVGQIDSGRMSPTFVEPPVITNGNTLTAFQMNDAYDFFSNERMGISRPDPALIVKDDDEESLSAITECTEPDEDISYREVVDYLSSSSDSTINNENSIEYMTVKENVQNYLQKAKLDGEIKDTEERPAKENYILENTRPLNRSNYLLTYPSEMSSETYAREDKTNAPTIVETAEFELQKYNNNIETKTPLTSEKVNRECYDSSEYSKASGLAFLVDMNQLHNDNSIVSDQDILSRRDSITCMAQEAVAADSSLVEDKDLGDIFEENKQYVTDSELFEVMSLTTSLSEPRKEDSHEKLNIRSRLISDIQIPIPPKRRNKKKVKSQEGEESQEEAIINNCCRSAVLHQTNRLDKTSENQVVDESHVASALDLQQPPATYNSSNFGSVQDGLKIPLKQSAVDSIYCRDGCPTENVSGNISNNDHNVRQTTLANFILEASNPDPRDTESMGNADERQPLSRTCDTRSNDQTLADLYSVTSKRKAQNNDVNIQEIPNNQMEYFETTICGEMNNPKSNVVQDPALLTLDVAQEHKSNSLLGEYNINVNQNIYYASDKCESYDVGHVYDQSVCSSDDMRDGPEEGASKGYTCVIPPPLPCISSEIETVDKNDGLDVISEIDTSGKNAEDGRSENDDRRDNSFINTVPFISVPEIDEPDKQRTFEVSDVSDEIHKNVSQPSPRGSPEPRAISKNESLASQKSSLLSPLSISQESLSSLYSAAGGGNFGKIPVTGEILFSLDYNYKAGTFDVCIKKCKDIAAVDTKKKRSDPYVKTYLLPDKTKNGKRKSRVKKHTLNPVYEEVLRYNVTKSELETRTLWLTVWHNDRFGRNDFLGEVTVPLDYYTFDDVSPKWHKLQERPAGLEDQDGNFHQMSLLTYKGDLNLSLKFVTPDHVAGKKGKDKGELHVLVKQARNLTAMRSNGYSDTFCKGFLRPEKYKSAKQKTPVIKKDCNPQWNHTFVFDDITYGDLQHRCLELSIWDHDRFSSNDFLGGVRMSLGTSQYDGKHEDWMDAKGEEISIWQAMIDRPNYWIDGTLLLRPNMDARK